MLLAEEFVLLIFDGESDKRTLSFEKYGPPLGAALLVDLALMERIAVAPQSASRRDRGRVTVTSTKPTDDSELDRVLRVVEEKEGIHISNLISDISSTRVTKGLLERLLQRLVTAGVLVQSHTDVLGLRRWPTADREARDEIRRRLQSCLVGGAQPTERTAALVSLLQVTHSHVHDRPATRRGCEESAPGEGKIPERRRLGRRGCQGGHRRPRQRHGLARPAMSTGRRLSRPEGWG